MRAIFDISLAAGLVIVFLIVPASGDDGYRARLTELETGFAGKYVKIASKAKSRRLADLTNEAIARAGELDPGHDGVIDFDPSIKRPLPPSRVRSAAKLRAEFVKTRREEARARLDLAKWCEEEVLLEEAVAQVAAALALVPGEIGFDRTGTIGTKSLGPLSTSLSLSVLEEHEVYRGSLVRRDAIPAKIPWEHAFRLETEHFSIVTNVSGDLCRTLGRALQAAREIYAEMTGYDVEARITVHVPATRAKYVDLWLRRGRPEPGKTNLGRCYRDFCGVDGSKPTREVVSVAIHEVAHGYLNLGLAAATGKRDVTMPPWFHEGLATYCAGYGEGSLSYQRGVVLPEIARAPPLARFRKLLEGGKAAGLGDFLASDAEGTDYYLQAYAFFWFLNETKDERIRKGFAAATAALKRAKLTGDDRIERGREILLVKIGVPLKDLEALFHAWVKSLEEAEPLTQRGV